MKNNKEQSTSIMFVHFVIFKFNSEKFYIQNSSVLFSETFISITDIGRYQLGENYLGN